MTKKVNNMLLECFAVNMSLERNKRNNLELQILTNLRSVISKPMFYDNSVDSWDVRIVIIIGLFVSGYSLSHIYMYINCFLKINNNIKKRIYLTGKSIPTTEVNGRACHNFHMYFLIFIFTHCSDIRYQWEDMVVHLKSKIKRQCSLISGKV